MNMQTHNIKNIKFEYRLSKHTGELIKVIFYNENDIEVCNHYLFVTCKTSFAILKSEYFLKALFKNINEFYPVINRISHDVKLMVDFLNDTKSIYLKEVKIITLDCSNNQHNELKSITFV